MASAKKDALKNAGANLALRNRGKYPTKTSINLAQAENGNANRLYGAIALVAIIIVVGLFAKYCVIDPLGNAMRSNAEVNSLEQQIGSLKTQTEALEASSEDYDRYIVSDWNSQEDALVDRAAIISLLKSTVMTIGDTHTLRLTENTVTAVVGGVTMSEVSAMVATLEQSDLTKYVTVTTAGDNSSESRGTTSATFNIVFDESAELDTTSNATSDDTTPGEDLGSALGVTRSDNAVGAAGLASSGSKAGE